jgi:sensor histidine kinase YesM
MFETILKSFIKRFVLSIVLALTGGFILEVIFKLQYRNYDLLQSHEWYIAALILTVLFTEVVFQLNRWLNRITPWELNPQRRMLVQGITHIFVGLVIFSFLRLAYIYVLSVKSFILLSDELLIAFYIICAIVVLNLIDFGVILINQWRYSLAEAEKYKKESAEFEFEMLQAQINPHFLFNSLNTLSSLVYEDADKSSEFIRRLSDVYRHVLEARQKDLISISEELSFIKSFIFLLELRFDKKLSISIEIDQELFERKMAPLTLQMLIENAVKHNIVSDKRPLHVRVFNNDKYIIVENPLQPKTDKAKGNKMGLKNISNRYKALCGEDVVIVEDNEKFTVKVPVI